MRLIILAFLSLIMMLQRAFAQNKPYIGLDSIMRNYRVKIKTPDDLYKVVHFIRKSFDADSLRLRASCVWITENIEYDIEAFLKEDPRAAQLDYVLKNKKAICSGYAWLLKYFCDAFTIECDVVNGYARSGKKYISLNQSDLRINHAWNAVKINDCWRLIDPTWAAGYMDDADEERPKYIKGFNELYYFTDPGRLILNHLPKHNKFQFLTKLVTEPNFKKWPLFMSGYLKSGIQKIYPDTSLIKIKKGDTLIIKFKFKSESPYTELCGFSDRLEKAYYNGRIVKKDDWYEFHYPVQLSGYYNLYIGHCPFETLVAYRLEVN
jgi:transglutaminase/protease-like cytokinesis protein 3